MDPDRRFTNTRCWLLALAALAVAAPGMAGLILPPQDLPVHDLVEILEGDFPADPEQDNPSGPRFGFSVALYGNSLAVGAPGARVHPSFERGGAVFVYERVLGEWSLAQRIPFDFVTLAGSDLECGHAVALDAYNLLVGCPGRAGEAGGAMLFTRPSAGAPFELTTSPFNPGTTPGERCGHSVALLGNADSGSYPLAAIGCPGRVTGGSVLAGGPGPAGVGAVDLQFYCPPFAACAGVWGVGWHPIQSFNGTLGGRGGAMPMEFGLSIDLQGYFGANILLAVGAPATETGEAGQVDVYRASVDDLSTWVLDLSITADQPARLGQSVDLATSNSIAYLVAGAPTHLDASATEPTGAAMIVTRTPFGWDAPEWLFVDDPGENGSNLQLGQSVHLANASEPPRILAGVPGGPAGWGPGQARHFYRDSDKQVWLPNVADTLSEPPEPLPTLFAPDFAWSMDGNGNLLAVGGPGYLDADGRVRGRVFIYAWDDRRFRDRFEQN